MKDILITKPASPIDGMNAVYNALDPYLRKEYYIRYFIRGPHNITYSNRIYSFLFPLFDLLRFIFDLIFRKPNMVLINSSLNGRCIIRDGIYVRICKFLHLKTVLFLHGFDYSILNKKDTIRRGLFFADMIIVLAKEFKDALLTIGCQKQISIISNPINLSLDEQFPNDFIDTKANVPVSNILFLSRIEKAKGVFVAIDAFSMIHRQYPNITLNIAGDGSSLQEVKEYVERNEIKNVLFYGFVQGKEKIDILKKCQILLFPSESEGFPMVILEAMDAGLVILSSAVGGTKDFFQNEGMGLLIENGNADDYYQALLSLIANPKLSEIGQYNHFFVKSHFSPDIIANKLLSYIKE